MTARFAGSAVGEGVLLHQCVQGVVAAPGVPSMPIGSTRGFFGSVLCNEIWRPQGFHTRLEAAVRGRQGRLIGSLVLYRGPGDPRFTRDDERRLARRRRS